MSAQAPLSITPDLLARYNIAGPRYTSYPTADRFTPAFGCGDLIQALQQQAAAMGSTPQPLSVYVHIPFCASLCYFCACNKIITRHREWAADYLQHLEQELSLYQPYLKQLAGTASRPTVTQLHLGGGSPTFLSDEELAQLMRLLQGFFHFDAAGGEFSIEVDPRTVDAQRMQHLKQLGFNRVSFGIQDFDAAVQQAVHRVQPAEQVFALVQAARAAGFASINTDLIYGLPHQSTDSFTHTLEQICALRPDRIALYAYAHLPERFKAQRRLDSQTLPTGNDKIHLLAMALQHFRQAGYVYVGMDHFALPDDELARAKQQGKLQRNFQGYSTRPDQNLIGLGVSAISRIGACYSQNAKTLDAYGELLENDQLPVERGLQLTRDDQIRHAVIMSIMCQGEVLFDALRRDWQIDFASHFAAECQRLAQLQEQGLLTLHGDRFCVTDMGWYFVRAVAMVFDHHLQTARAKAASAPTSSPHLADCAEQPVRFSKIL
ncbi:MAG: oxygen-independent coproporphyrinogen III oxidase [Brachymonas sp.]|nr:oxygen-independent coproporphyrinogen III oxidase [Brachymonas sp.]